MMLSVLQAVAVITVATPAPPTIVAMAPSVLARHGHGAVIEEVICQSTKREEVWVTRCQVLVRPAKQRSRAQPPKRPATKHPAAKHPAAKRPAAKQPATKRPAVPKTQRSAKTRTRLATKVSRPKPSIAKPRRPTPKSSKPRRKGKQTRWVVIIPPPEPKAPARK